MTMMLRVVLILVSVGTMTMMIQKIRKATLQIEDSIFWVLVSMMFVVFSLFPSVADFLAHLLGIYATVNFLFLFMIFLLLMRVFAMTIRISQLETKVKELAQAMALAGLEREEEETAARTGGGVDVQDAQEQEPMGKDHPDAGTGRDPDPAGEGVPGPAGEEAPDPAGEGVPDPAGKGAPDPAGETGKTLQEEQIQIPQES